MTWWSGYVSSGVSWLQILNEDETIIGMSGHTCIIADCGRGGKLTRGMCTRHYRYWLDHTPHEERPLPPRLARDFHSFISKRHELGCWTWTGPRNRQGYGLWGKVLAHRHSWELANGPIPEGLWILHHCDNKPCVNPSHLYAGTRAENTQDAIDRGRIHHPPRRSHCPAGHAKEGDNLVTVMARGRPCYRCRTCERARKRDCERRRRERLRKETTDGDR